jgi:hypothetical protein
MRLTTWEQVVVRHNLPAIKESQIQVYPAA